MSKLTILSFGAGQDSTAILYKLVYDKMFRKTYAPKDLMVVMADTRNEHVQTNKHRRATEKFCRKHGIPFIFVLPEDYASGDWTKGYINFLEVGNRIGSKCFPKTCTDNLKIKPIYKWLDEYIFKEYGYGHKNKSGKLMKTPIKEFNEKYGKITVLLGIAKGEEKRAGSNQESPSVWMRNCINKVYPLIELGMDRQACQDYIHKVGHIVPPPSNCILCPFMSYQELLYLARYERLWFNKWVELERNKIEANKHVENNMGVWGEKLLPEALEIAKKKFGHMTYDELHEYKMSHGHCVKSKY